MKERIGVSAAIAAIAAAVFLLVGLYTTTLVLVKTGYGGAAQRWAAQELNRRASERIEIYISPSSLDEKPGTKIIFLNRWGDISYIDHIIVLGKNGCKVLELNREAIPEDIKLLLPGDSIALKPSQLGLNAQYDDDYWLIKKQVSRIVVHTEAGNVFSSIFGRPSLEIEATYMETAYTVINRTTITITTTTTSYTTVTTTTTTTIWI